MIVATASIMPNQIYGDLKDSFYSSTESKPFLHIISVVSSDLLLLRSGPLQVVIEYHGLYLLYRMTNAPLEPVDLVHLELRENSLPSNR